MIIEKVAIAKIRSVMLKKGYAFWDTGDLNLNIIGIRKANGRVDAFDDWITCIYKRNDQWCMNEWAATTDPGLFWMKNFDNPKGVAFLVPGQYLSAWQIGLHRGKYEALVQTRPVTVYRDNNKNDIIELAPETKDTGLFGINIHRAHEQFLMDKVDQWSAGCMVIDRPEDFAQFIGLCKESANKYGNHFTYTLLDEMDLYS